MRQDDIAGGGEKELGTSTGSCQLPAGVRRHREVSGGPVLPPSRPAGGGTTSPDSEGFPAELWRGARQIGSDFRARWLRALTLHRWVRWAVIIADGKRVTARGLELTDTLSVLPPQTLKEARERVKREMVQEAMRRHRGRLPQRRWSWGLVGRLFMS
jgi:hypothetical protein